MAYIVNITKRATGERREIRLDLAWEEGTESWWSEGNMSCDCNREALFEGREDIHVKFPCGDGNFTVNSIVAVELGAVVYAEQAPEHFWRATLAHQDRQLARVK